MDDASAHGDHSADTKLQVEETNLQQSSAGAGCWLLGRADVALLNLLKAEIARVALALARFAQQLKPNWLPGHQPGWVAD